MDVILHAPDALQKAVQIPGQAGRIIIEFIECVAVNQAQAFLSCKYIVDIDLRVGIGHLHSPDAHLRTIFLNRERGVN